VSAIEPSVDALSVDKRCGMLPWRTFHCIVRQFYSSMVKVKAGAKVITIEPARNALTVEWVVELFGAAFGRVCVECFLARFADGVFKIATQNLEPFVTGPP
jgi:hypothetical protein